MSCAKRGRYRERKKADQMLNHQPREEQAREVRGLTVSPSIGRRPLGDDSFLRKTFIKYDL